MFDKMGDKSIQLFRKKMEEIKRRVGSQKITVTIPKDGIKKQPSKNDMGPTGPQGGMEQMSPFGVPGPFMGGVGGMMGGGGPGFGPMMPGPRMPGFGMDEFMKMTMPHQGMTPGGMPESDVESPEGTEELTEDSLTDVGLAAIQKQVEEQIKLLK